MASFDCFYAFEEPDQHGRMRWVFAYKDRPKVPIEGEDPIEVFHNYCKLAAACGLTAAESYAPVTRKRAKELAAQAKAERAVWEAERAAAERAAKEAEAEAKRTRHDELPAPVVVPPNRPPREKAEPAPDSTGAPPGEPPRRRSRERGPARFKEGDIVKAIKAARKAKMEIAAVKIEPDGSILIIPGTPEAVSASEPNPLDEEFGRRPPHPPPRRRYR